MSDEIEKKVFFGIGPGFDNSTALIIGIPKGAWEFMKDGKNCHFDLEKVGIPLKVILFGAESHDECFSTIQGHNEIIKRSTIDLRDQDFSIKEPTKQ